MTIQFFIMLVLTYNCSKSVQVFPFVYKLAKTPSSSSFVVIVLFFVVVAVVVVVCLCSHNLGS